LNRILGRAQLEKEDVKLLRSLLALVSRSHSENRGIGPQGRRE
jgi:tRNA C32,U32 (ribose-2'-O)-methylase TrmJ